VPHYSESEHVLPTVKTASSVVISRGIETQQPIIMQVNRPFYFMIRENKTGLILFLGRVINPKS
jgi:serine protease inhibitor